MGKDERKQELIQRFDTLYSTGERVWGGKPTDTVAESLKWLAPGPVLDLGAGDGRHALFLAHNGFDVTAVDISAEAIKRLEGYARQQRVSSRITGVVADLEHYVPEGELTNVVSTFTLHFLHAGAFAPLLERVMRATRPGGVHVIDDFTRNGPLYRPDSLGHWLVSQELKQFYEAAGWEVLYYTEAQTETKATDEQGNPYHQEAASIIARKQVLSS